MVSIRSGAGTILIGNSTQDGRMGLTFSVPEGAAISFDNSKGEAALAARAILVSRP